MIARRGLLRTIVAAGCALTAAGPAAAQSYPNRPVRFIVPFPAGGSADVTARLLAEHLARVFGQQVYVENRTGGSGVIGTEAVAKSPPDGYTVLIGSSAVPSAPHTVSMTIDPMRDLTPVILLSRQPVVLAVHPSLQVNTVAELVAAAKERPGLSYGTGGGAASTTHFVVEWFAHIAGIKLAHVPYRGGGQAINDLIAGHVKIGSLGSTPLIPHYKAGTLRLLAQSTAARSPALPEVPTYQDAGIKGLVLDQWFGVFVPAGTPPAVNARLNTEINKALTDPSIRQGLLQQAQEPLGGSAEGFARLVRDDFEKYQRLVKELNIKAN